MSGIKRGKDRDFKVSLLPAWQQMNQQGNGGKKALRKGATVRAKRKKRS